MLLLAQRGHFCAFIKKARAPFGAKNNLRKQLLCVQLQQPTFVIFEKSPTVNQTDITHQAKKVTFHQFKNMQILNIPKCPIGKKCYLLPTFHNAKCHVLFLDF